MTEKTMREALDKAAWRLLETRINGEPPDVIAEVKDLDASMAFLLGVTMARQNPKNAQDIFDQAIEALADKAEPQPVELETVVSPKSGLPIKVTRTP